jgi:hypothetical protein
MKEKSSLLHEQGKKTYESALKDLDSAGAECVSTMPEYQAKAKAIIAQMKAVENQITEQQKEVKKAKSNLTIADCFIGGQRDKKDRIGWRYTGSKTVHPMSTYNNRDKTKTVKFLYKEDTRKQDGLKDASSAHSRELANCRVKQQTRRPQKNNPQNIKRSTKARWKTK